MSERHDFECGCAYVKAGQLWYQVVACPEHTMDMRPKMAPVVTARAPR